MTKKKILIIDDSKMILNDLSKKLEEAGYETITSEKTLGASQIVLDKEPDLIILDIKVPSLSGTELLKVFDSIPKLPPILIFSELDNAELEQICKETKATSYLQKSDKEKLLAKVSELLKD